MITIKLDKANKCNGEYSLYLTFRYNPDIVNIIRDLPIRYWHPELKEWEIPFKYFSKLKDIFKNYQLNVLNYAEIKKLEVLNNQATNYIPNDYKFKIDAFKHQIEGINFGLKYDKFVLGDEQGLGKTMQAINIACIKKEQKHHKHCLIICGVNGLKWNWQSEIEKHSCEHGYILGTRYDKKGRAKIGSMNDRLFDLYDLLDYDKDSFPINQELNNSYFIITNIETLRNEEIIEKLKELCDKKIINMLVLDEGHKCKDPTSIQGKHLLKLKADSMISMTGTPLMNYPLDLYIHLKWLGYESHGFYQFKQHYCIYGGYGGYQIIGYKNLDQLKEQFDEIMLRRLKKDVLDLPEKIHTTDYVELSPKQKKIYKEIYSEISDNIDLVSAAVNPLTEMIRLRQATGFTGILSSTIQESAKFERLLEILDELAKNNKKAIVFSNWTAIINPLYEILAQYNPAIITGEVKNRVEQEKKFMEDDTCRVIIGTIGAMGTGLTLTAANTVIFLDEPWNKAIKDQAEDRAHRIGTTENVNIITLIAKDTIDERINELVEKKGAMADMLIDGKLTAQTKQQLVEFLLS